MVARLAAALTLVLLIGCGTPPAPSAPPPPPAPTAAPTVAPVAAPTPAPTAVPAPTKLTVSYGNISGDSLVAWVTKEGGYFDQNGLDVDLQLVSGGPNALSSLISGQMQFAHIGGPEVLNATTSGADLV